MSDDKNKTKPQDASRINVNEDYEVKYWTEKFNCSKEELKKAVVEVGTSAEKVGAHLKKQLN